MSLLLFILIVPALFTIPIAFCWKQFEKAGQKGWYSLIPYYNIFVMLKIIGKQKKFWWWFFIVFPYINIFMLLLMLVELGKCFGRFKIWEEGMAAILPCVFFPFIIKDDTYQDPLTAKRPKKSTAREWFDAIVFAVVAALIIRTYVFEMFTIPTSSMEKSLCVGDYLVVSKIHYGPKGPNTPLSFPFVHNTLPWSKTAKSYVEWIKLPYHRYPGVSTMKRYDPIVFNYPAGDTVCENYQSSVNYYDLVRKYGRKEVWSGKVVLNLNGVPTPSGKVIAHPVDKRENYVKRLIGMPGDSLQIINSVVYINGEKAFQPEHAQFCHTVVTNGTPINDKVFEKHDITELYDVKLVYTASLSEGMAKKLRKESFVASVTQNADSVRYTITTFGTAINEQTVIQYAIGDLHLDNIEYGVYISETVAEELRKLPFVTSVTKDIQPDGEGTSTSLFPNRPDLYPWNVDNFGPIYIPQKGVTVKLDVNTLPFYERIIHAYELHDLKVEGDNIYIDGQLADSYTFEMDYYWMMGDNRHNSADSRYWGYVPEDHIVGKPILVWLSRDKENGGIRWKRMFRIPK